MIATWRRLWGLPSKEEARARADAQAVPTHVAVIMDGNGRWATRQGLPRVAGHRAGVASIRPIVETCQEVGVKYLTLYAFSTENWKRPAEEVDALMELLVEFLRKEIAELHRNRVRVRAIGRWQELPPLQVQEITKAIALTENNDGLTLQLALNYGGRAELADALKLLAEEVAAGRLQPAEITPELIATKLYTGGQPDPDLLIRTGGDQRLSNFLLWQAAYAEIYLTPIYWPDFGREQLLEAFADFARRERRFGGILPQSR